MRTFALKNGDIYVDKMQIAFISDNDEVAQSIGTRLSTIQGEYWYDKTYGVPYWDVIENANSIAILNLSIKNVIYGTDGVKDIYRFNSQLDSVARTYTINVSVTTTNDILVNLNKIYSYGRIV